MSTDHHVCSTSSRSIRTERLAQGCLVLLESAVPVEGGTDRAEGVVFGESSSPVRESPMPFCNEAQVAVGVELYTNIALHRSVGSEVETSPAAFQGAVLFVVGACARHDPDPESEQKRHGTIAPRAKATSCAEILEAAKPHLHEHTDWRKSVVVNGEVVFRVHVRDARVVRAKLCA